MPAPQPLSSLQVLAAKLANKAFYVREALRARASARAPLAVLFSPGSAWEAGLRRGFCHTRDRIAFAALTERSVAAHDVVVPLTMNDQRLLAGLRVHAVRSLLPVPGVECIRLCDDKPRLNERLAASGFAAELPPPHTPGTYPYILKKRIDEFGRNSHVVRDAAEERTLDALKAGSDYFCQGFVPGPVEYATHVLMKGGRIACSLTVRYVFAVPTPVKGRDPPLYTRVCRAPDLRRLEAMLQTIGYDGLCCINYKLHGGRTQLLEINPRFGASLAPYFFSFMRHLTRLP